MLRRFLVGVVVAPEQLLLVVVQRNVADLDHSVGGNLCVAMLDHDLVGAILDTLRNGNRVHCVVVRVACNDMPKEKHREYPTQGVAFVFVYRHVKPLRLLRAVVDVARHGVHGEHVVAS